MTPRVSSGDRIPQAQLSRLLNNRVEQVPLQAELASKRAILVGVPGAFTPVCTCEHIPNLLGNVDKLRASGIQDVIVVAPDNPWAVDAWAHAVDPNAKLSFFSDRNLSLARALGVAVLDPVHGLGETTARYMMVVGGGLVHRLTVEPHHMTLSCTRAEDAVLID